MLKKSTHHKRNVFMFLFTALFGVVSWLYFYFNFFNFFILKEDQFIIDQKNKLIVIAENRLDASIPKKGIKINADKYQFSTHQSTLSDDTIYQVTFKIDTFNVILVKRPVLALHIINYRKNEEQQKMRWELKQPNHTEQIGFGLINKKHLLLDRSDLELRFFLDSLYSKPATINIDEKKLRFLELVKKEEKTINLSINKEQNVVPLFINGELQGVYELKEE